MSKKQLAVGFGGLVALAAVGTLLADGPREALQRVMYTNGIMLMFLSGVVGARETCDADGPCRVRPATRWPTLSAFAIVAACCTAGWLSTSLLLGGIAWQTWLTAYVGLLTFGCGVLYLRWRFQSLVPALAYGIAFVVFAHVL